MGRDGIDGHQAPRPRAARTRWVALGATLAGVLGAAGVLTSSAAGSPPSSLVAITPCRLIDTRAGTDNVGGRATPLTAGESYTAAVAGTNGNCTLPTNLTAVSLNVTIIGPTAASFLTVFPADAPKPVTANLNWVAGQPPTPNAVTVATSADGRIAFFNFAGTVQIAVDVVGYYAPSPTGPPGPKGDPGPRPARVIWVATSGGDFTSIRAALASITDADATHPYVIKIAPGTYAEAGGIDLKDHVDLEGSGPTTTTITCACASNINPRTDNSSATLRAEGAGLRATVRQLAVLNTGGGGQNTVAVIVRGATTSVAFEHVRAEATGSPEVITMWMLGAPVSLSYVDVRATGGLHAYAFFESNAAVAADHLTATASGAANTDDAIYVEDATASAYSSVTATATGGAGVEHVGITVLGSAVSFDQIVAQTDAVGIWIDADGSTASSVSVQRLHTSGADFGVLVFDSVSTVIIGNSEFVGGLNSVYTSSARTHLSDSRADAGTVGLASRCSNVFNAAFTAYTCT